MQNLQETCHYPPSLFRSSEAHTQEEQRPKDLHVVLQRQTEEGFPMTFCSLFTEAMRNPANSNARKEAPEACKRVLGFSVSMDGVDRWKSGQWKCTILYQEIPED